MGWPEIREQIGYALTGVESYEAKKKRMSDVPSLAETHWQTQAERLEHILTDLIAELRHWVDSDLLGPDSQVLLTRLADNAEARLREARDD